MLPSLWAGVRRVGRVVRWGLTLLVLALLLRNSTTQFGEPYYALSWYVKEQHFDYIGWELGAIGAKVGQSVAATHAYMPEADRSAYVRAYFDDLARVRAIEAEIAAIYTDPNMTDPDTASIEQRTQRDTLRASLSQRQTMTEAILESQVSAVLVDHGFSIGGQVFPPVWMRFTQPMMLLVTSPRDTIEMQHVYTVEPIPIDEREQIEAAILTEEDVSAVIVPIGGMALYPAMIVESSSIPWIVETFAHEWFHHYLMFYPLGWETELFNNAQARIINETTATLFGREIAAQVLTRYYPDLLPPAPPPSLDATPPPRKLAFDYNREMNRTRVITDQLLTKGEIDAAEHYMAARRELFVAQGYGIRKLNQAWFSFYGGYQVSGISAGGADPIGPKVQQLRDEAASLREWVQLMRGLTTRDALLRAAE